jgi:hypothetical protein
MQREDVAANTASTLRHLLDMVKDQIAAETPDPEEREHRFEKLTVAQLLDMLSYMF